MSEPKYRVRLFLSVDLAGSTAFKARQSNPMDWVPTFRDFYDDFGSIFSARFANFCQTHNPHCNGFSAFPPSIWKTIGDEIIFSNRVENCTHVFAYVHSFVEAMGRYAEKLDKDENTKGMDVKGNAWIASFPFPNQTIVVDHNVDFVTEQHEAEADHEPRKYEFLGPGIDAGFRIARNSHPSFMTVSPALARLLCQLAGNQNMSGGQIPHFPMIFKGMNELKGVLNGGGYPIIGLNTERDKSRRELAKLERSLLGQNEAAANDLETFLNQFVSFHKVPEPILKLQPTDHQIPDPEYYTNEFLPRWRNEFGATAKFDENLEDSSKEDEGTEITEAEASQVVNDAFPNGDT